MANKVLSIYVGSDAIRIAEMQKSGNNKAVVLSNAAEVATPNNSVNDGYLVDITAIAEAIRTSIFGRGFTAKEVIFTITSKKIASKEVEIPYVKNPKKLQQILQANSGEYFPMSNTGDYSFAYSVLEDYTTEEGRKSRVSAVAAPNDLVKCYYELAEELKFTINSIDYFGNSVIQLLSMQMTEGRTDLVLQIEKDTTFVNVMRGKTLILQRSVPYGKNAVINALMDVKKISEKDAKTLLSNETLLDQHVTADEYAETVQYLVNGIGRVVEYHRTKNKSDLLQGIKVFGEGSAIAGIERILERELGAPVEHFETLAGVAIKGQAALTAEEVLRYLPNIGAVIAPIGLSVDTSSGSSSSIGSEQFFKILVAIFVVCAVVMGAWVGKTAYDYNKVLKQQQQLEADIAAIEDIVQIAEAYENAQAELNILKDFVASTQSDNELLLTFILDLEKMLPKDAAVQSLSAENGDITFDVISGWHVTTKNEIADVIYEIGNLEYMTRFDLPGFKEEYQTLFVIGYDEEGEAVYLREPTDENGKIGDYIVYEEGKEYPAEYMEYERVTLVQTTYDVSCHISLPVEETEEETEETTAEDGTAAETTEGGEQ
ncbi:MAG: pilus assembly protein PilM [Lachnospiraceae bacterium]|nr:pilus assembly protein PilM [Lachnospiraceae bacterium]